MTVPSLAPRAARVIVVGGGPAGAASAWALASLGHEVLILDRARFPRDKACAEYLSPQASRVLHAMGVLGDVERAGAAQLAGMTVRAPDGGIIHGEFAARHGFTAFRDRGLALRRRRLDPILLDGARRAGAQLREGVAVHDLERNAHGDVCGVWVRDAQGGAQRLRADLVIGADGLRSVVGRRLGVAAHLGWPFPRRVAFVAHWRGVQGVGAHGEMHVERDGYVGIADVGHGEVNVAIVVPRGRARDAAGDAAGFMDRWLARRPQLAPRFAGAARVTPVRATGPFAARATRAWAPGALLAGDAADFFDPFTGEGIYAALRGGELLAPFAADALRASGRGARLRALAAYDGARRREFGGKWLVERLIGTAVAVPALMNHAARTLGARRDMADLLVGVTGDIVPAREVLRPGFLLRLLAPPLRRAP
ncbi:MAG: FAD-dependent monooxygenase [Gemmatimonadaceae bacterium]|jgi:flavin-dependent dehydrogenase|nr:FAD-dependent monooxygenase [Gemmatimonadaceae bacterium]